MTMHQQIVQRNVNNNVYLYRPANIGTSGRAIAGCVLTQGLKVYKRVRDMHMEANIVSLVRAFMQQNAMIFEIYTNP